jgi:ArsR family transcriptional regulator
VTKKQTLSEQQIHLIAKALADPRRHEILQQIGACRDTASCVDIRECQPVTAAALSTPLAHFGRVAWTIGKPVS